MPNKELEGFRNALSAKFIGRTFTDREKKLIDEVFKLINILEDAK